MAVIRSVATFAALGPAALRLLDFRCIEQRSDDRCRADPNCNACLDQLGPPFLVSPVVAHSALSHDDLLRPYALPFAKGSAA